MSHDLYQWAADNMQSVTAMWVPKETVEAEKNILADRFKKAIPLPGTRSYHSFEPVTQCDIAAKITSSSSKQAVFRVFDG